MNCRTFENMIDELSREQLMDADMRARALQHAEDCKRCANILANERALTAGLRAFAESVAEVEAPARVEAALLSAFRARESASKPFALPVAPSQDSITSVALSHASVTSVALSQASLTSLDSRWRRRRFYWSSGIAAVAAVLLLAVTFNIFRAQPPLASNPARSEAPRDPALVRTPVVPHVEIAEQGSEPPADLHEGLSQVTRDNGPTLKPAYVSVANTTRVTQRFNRRRASALTRGRELEEAQAANALNALNNLSSAGQTEIATDFIPLTYDSNLNSLESGHVVRVELPRSALVSMGLPMSMERAGEPVQADVVLGDDGIARAIRFVR